MPKWAVPQCGVIVQRCSRTAANLEEREGRKKFQLRAWLPHLVVPLTVEVMEGGNLASEVHDLVVSNDAFDTARNRQYVWRFGRENSPSPFYGIENNELPIVYVPDHI